MEQPWEEETQVAGLSTLSKSSGALISVRGHCVKEKKNIYILLCNMILPAHIKEPFVIYISKDQWECTKEVIQKYLFIN